MAEQLEKVSAVGSVASKERGMLLALDKMEQEWAGLEFRVMPYKATGVNVLTSIQSVGHRRKQTWK